MKDVSQNECLQKNLALDHPWGNCVLDSAVDSFTQERNCTYHSRRVNQKNSITKETNPRKNFCKSKPKPKPAPKTADDLKRIEGIGPKTADALQAAGITTFAQLAAIEIEELKKILREGGVRAVRIDTWSEQANLAADGKWDALSSLQKKLKGGVKK